MAAAQVVICEQSFCKKCKARPRSGAFSRRVALVRQIFVAAALAIVLAGLAVLQYRWLGDVSAAERARMRDNLQSRAGDVAEAFDSELTKIFLAFHVDADRLNADAAGTISEAYTRWEANAAHPSAVRAIDVLDPADLAVLRR